MGSTCFDMLPAAADRHHEATQWLKSVCEAHDCSSLLASVPRDDTQPPLQRFRGNKWEVTIKAEAQACVVLFRGFATVRTRNLMCPSGSAAYYELHVVREDLCSQWGFCSEVFQQVDAFSSDGVGDDRASWGIDGDCLLKWHNGSSSPWGGQKWREGDVIGLACDLRADHDASLGDMEHETGQTHAG